MAKDPSLGKKSAFAIASTLAWFALLVAFLATTASMTINGMNHLGDTASSIINRLSANPVAIDSLLNDFRKNADSKTVAEIDQNRSKIESTIASLAGDEGFQKTLASTFNKISEAILNGADSVSVDFGPLAAAIADKVNATSKSPVISKQDLAKLKPQVLDLSKQSRSISSVRSRLFEVTLAWVLWLILISVIYLLKKWKVLGTAGWQLLSVGIVFLLVHISTPVVAEKVLHGSTVPIYQKDLVQEVLKILFRPMMTLSIIAVLAGMVLVIANLVRVNRSSGRPSQINPRVVA